jgi:hypothetical protein
MNRLDHGCKGKVLKNTKNVKNAIFNVFVPVERSYVCPGLAI